jgi:hypothetical protein
MTRRITVTLRSSITAILFAAMAALTPATMFAQITTFVAPPRKAAVDSAKATVAAAKAKADTTARMTLSDMKAWVDSAAGVSTATQVATTDTTAVSTTQPGSAVAPNRTNPATTTFSNGAIAPNTASPLPFYAAGGFVLLLIGVGTLRLARRRA